MWESDKYAVYKFINRPWRRKSTKKIVTDCLNRIQVLEDANASFGQMPGFFERMIPEVFSNATNQPNGN